MLIAVRKNVIRIRLAPGTLSGNPADSSGCVISSSLGGGNFCFVCCYVRLLRINMVTLGVHFGSSLRYFPTTRAFGRKERRQVGGHVCRLRPPFCSA